MAESTNSCGTRCCSCTPGTEAAARSEAPPRSPGSVREPEAASCGRPDGAALLRELDRLRTLLAGCAAGRDDVALRKGERLLVIARFAPGVTLEAWNALDRDGASEVPARAATGADAWFALDLDPARHPQLLGLSRDATPLSRLICPLTGALLPAAFQPQLAAEIERTATKDGELTLVLFEIAGGASERRNPPAPTAPPSSGPAGQICPAHPASAPFPPSALDDSLCSLARLVRTHARATDIPGRLAADRLAVLMPGVGPFRARALTERLMTAFREETGSPDAAAPLRAGIACCDGEMPLTAEALIGQASTALALARPGFTRTFRKAGAPEPERKTQVQACEKAFLFFGDTE